MNSRDRRPLLHLVAYSLVVLGATSLMAVSAPQDGAFPTEEGKLFEYARNEQNANRHQRAETAWRRFIETFPKSPQIGEAYFSLINLYHYQLRHRMAQGRDLCLEFIRNHPKHARIWEARFHLAQFHQQLNNKDEAKKVLRTIIKDAPDSSHRTQAIHQFWQVDNKQFRLFTRQSFTTGQEAAAHAYTYNVESASFRAYRIPYDVVLRAIAKGGPVDLRKAIAEAQDSEKTLIREWTENFKDHKNWRQQEITFGARESGIYLVEAEHDGIVMTVRLLVARNGLITKSASGKLLVFAQERASGKPVPDMKIRILQDKAPAEGVTDGQGLFVTDAYTGGAVLGVKDGELVGCETWLQAVNDGQPMTYITTDRPIYRPNHTVHFNIVHRTQTAAALEVKKENRLQVTIHDAKGNVVYKEPHEFNEWGTTSGQFTLGDEPPLGVYSIQVTPVGENPQRPYYIDWDRSWYGGYQDPPACGKFRVDEYRKPEYKVDVAFDRPRYLQGESVTATIQADYYFGSPVANAQVTYTVQRRHHWSWWRCWAYYYDWYAEDEDQHYRRGRGWGGEHVMQGSGTLDKEGRLKLNFPTGKLEYDSIYTVSAQVTDLSRRTVDGGGSVKATRAEFNLSVNTDRYVYKPGEKVGLQVRAATPDDEPVRNTDVKIAIYKRTWANNQHRDDQLVEETKKTGENGIANASILLHDDGYLHVVATSTDAKGNAVRGEGWVWITGHTWGANIYNFSGLSITPDRKTYDRGDRASVLLTSQHKDISVLVTLEGHGLYRQEVVEIKGHARLYEVALDRLEYIPNVFLHVSALKDNQLVQASRMLVVNPSERFINVKVTPERATYRPREAVRYAIETTDQTGKPVSAEVALGVVDESIYALQDEYAMDIRKHFVHKRRNFVATRSSLEQYEEAEAGQKQAKPDAPAPASGAARGRRGFLMEEAGDDRDEGAHGEAFAATETRSLFADTMLWLAHVRTDAQGRATVEAPAPDNLTTWRATARAITMDSRFGQATSSVVCRKDVIVRLETPRFFSQNDRSVISAIAHNYLPVEKNFKVVLEVDGLQVTGDLSHRISIPAEGEKRIDWKVAAGDPGIAKITVKLLSDRESDAMELSIPVQPHGAMRWKSFAGVVEDRIVQKITAPEGSMAGAGDLLIVVSPTHAATVLDALDYLAGYPYGCVEQTMSRFLPTVVVSQAIQRLGLQKPDLMKELPAMVAAGLQRLYNFQHDDGGWGWWQNDATHPPITAYVMIGLAMARAADHKVDDNVFARGVQALRQQLAQPKLDDSNAAYLLYALSLCGENQPKVLERLAGAEKLSPYARALLALVLHKQGKSAEAKTALAALAADAQGDGAHAWWGGAENRYGWFDHHMEITAAALRAFLAIDPKNPIVSRAVTWLSSVREGGHWASTKQTALVVNALCEYLAVSGDMNPDMTLTVTLNGKQLLRDRVTKDNWHNFDGSRLIPARQLRAGDNEIVIEKEGSGTPIYSIYHKTYTSEEDIPASKQGLRIDRKYAKVVMIGGKREVAPLADGAVVKSGDEVEVTLTIIADREYEYLMIDDPLPSGFEPIREHWGHYGWGRWAYWYAHKEFRDERVSIAVTHLAPGTRTIQYVMRAETPGDLHVLPARVWNMYFTQIGGNSAENRIKVED